MRCPRVEKPDKGQGLGCGLNQRFNVRNRPTTSQGSKLGLNSMLLKGNIIINKARSKSVYWVVWKLELT